MRRSTCCRRGDFAPLTELKASYDPDNTFRINHNIPPKTKEI